VRYAEVLLTHAEAAFQTGNESEAYETLNIVHERAMRSIGPKGSILGEIDTYPAETSTLAALPSLSGQEFLNAIKHERRVELGVEGIRTYDLIRWGNMKVHFEIQLFRTTGSLEP
jgi:hypothetical protein